MEANWSAQENAVGWQSTDALVHYDSATTAGLPNQRQQPVRNKIVKSSSTTAVDVVHRLAASPRQMKTQIARISYTPTRPSKAVRIENQHLRKPLTTFVQKIHTESSVTSPPTPAQTADNKNHTREEYAKRKYERHREIQEIQTMLKDIAKSPQKPESKTSGKGKIAVDITKSEADTMGSPTLRRSKTEWLGSRLKAATTRREYARASSTERPRSRSSQPAATKSRELLSEDVGSKKKSYNAEEARQFMEEQKRRRRLNRAEIPQIYGRSEKTSFEKEQIKKRLEELRKYSRKIVSNNISKKFATKTVGNFQKTGGADRVGSLVQADCKYSLDKTNPNTGLTIEISYKDDYDTASGDKAAVTVEISERGENAENEQSSRVLNSPLKNILMSKSDTQIPALKAQISNSNTTDRFNVPLIENQKRIGLLRKPETKDHSFSAIKEFSFDKENVALERLTPKMTTSVTVKSAVHEQPLNEIVQTTQSISDMKDQEAQTCCEAATTALTNLGAQTVSSNMHTSEEKRSQELLCERGAEKQAKKDEVGGTEEQHDLPYWLKPSAVQIYPYNFIMAVRRKLEAITEPEELKCGITHDKTTSTGDFDLMKPRVDTPRTFTSKKGVSKAQKYVRRRIVAEFHSTSSQESFATHTIERNNVHVNKELENSSVAVKKTVNRSETLSDLNSNFSSISIQVPTSNSNSELSSIRSGNVQTRTSKRESCLESRNLVQTDDDTTISSSVFNSPKKNMFQSEIDSSRRPISPLSLERVENLKITSSNKLKKAIDDKHVNINRGNFISNALEKTSKAKLDTNVDLGHLLIDFNRSLSQVIEVNEKLRNTLDKSHHKLNYINSTPQQDESTLKSKQSHEYTTDFEEPSESEECKNSIKQQPAGNIKNKKSLFEITDVVKPLLASPISDDSDTSTTQFEKESSSHLDLNVSSVTNFSRSSLKSCRQDESRNAQEEVVEVAEPLQKEFEKKLKVFDEMKTSFQQSNQNVQINRQVLDDEEEAKSNKIKSSDNEKDEGKYTQCVKGFTNHSKSALELDSANKESYKNDSRTDSDRSKQSKLNFNEISAQYETKSFVPMKISSFQQNNTKLESNKTNDQSQGYDSSNSTKTCLTGSINTFVNQSINDNDNIIFENIRHDCSESNTIHNLKGVPETPPSKRNTDSEVAQEVGERACSFFQRKEKRSTMPCPDNVSSSISISPPGCNCAVVLNTGAKPRSQKRKASSTLNVNVNSTETIGNKVISLFQHSNLDLSALSSHNDNLSESSRSYTSIGLYEKLILNETTKSEHLTALLKLREKALLDRTKGQIAWLEIQKERCKTKGLHTQIAAIKKKQRGIIIKMEKERDDIKRLLQSSSSPTSKQASSTQLLQETIILPVDESRSHTRRKIHRAEYSSDTQATKVSPALVSFRPSPTHLSRSARIVPQNKAGVPTVHSAPILRATYELESSRSLEELLSKREAALRRRRQHVERLMNWHRRLDQEETEVLQMERALLNCHNENDKSPKQTKDALTAKSSSIELLTAMEYSEAPKAISSSSSVEMCQNTHPKMESRLQEIEKSLQELSTISSSNSAAVNVEADGSEHTDFVRTSGSKLNKLWRRLTSQQTEKFEANKRYKLCKRDLEQIYEEAKISVLHDFSQNEEHIATVLLERSASTLSNSQAHMENAEAGGETVPSLNLNFSSEQSDPEPEELSVAEASSNSLLLDNYSPSIAEENFRVQVASEPSISITESDSNSSLSSSPVKRKQQIEHNMRTFLAFVETTRKEDYMLRRSLSDTQLTKSYLAKERVATTSLSQPNVAVISINTVVNNRRTELLVPSKPCVGREANSSLQSTTSQTVPYKQCNTELENSIVNDNISNTKEIFPAQKVVHIVSNTSSGTALSETSVDCESNADEMSANCEQTPISEVELSLSKSIAINSDQIRNSLEIKDLPTDIDMLLSIRERNFNSISSYSYESENISMDLQAISSCTGCTSEKSSLTTASIPVQDYSNDIINENADRANNNQTSPTFGALLFEAHENKGNAQKSANEKNLLETYETDFESETDETCIEDLSLPHFKSAINTINDDDESPEGTVNAPTKHISPVSEQANTLVEDSKDTAQLMPDIINELEIRRCRQIVQENEQLKQYEHITAVPYMYVREIPNKPPPPYVPPAHGSPMTTIFPSVERIKDITYRRSHELYCEVLKTDYTNERGEKLPSVMEEKITNIYERIILDICREYLEEHHEMLTQGDPSNFHSQLAFFNPPDRLRCIQESIYKEVRRCLAMDKTSPKRAQVYSVYGQRAKCDHIGKIIIQEMYDEDDKWCSFHGEETEVLELIIEEIIGSFLSELAREVLLAEGGTIEEEEEQDANETGNEERFEDTAATSIDINASSSQCQVAAQGQNRQSSLEKNQVNDS